jgi:hypothetical protein
MQLFEQLDGLIGFDFEDFVHDVFVL